MVRRKRIALIDSIPLYRSGAKLTLEKAGFNIVAESNVAVDALSIAERLNPDAMLMDISSNPGLDTVIELIQANPGVALILVVASELIREMSNYLGLGAKGCIPQDVSQAELITAVETVAKGKTYLSPAVERGLSVKNESTLAKPSLDAVLTRKEQLILAFVANGDTNKIIARRLGMGDQTLKNYMTRIMKKIEVRNRLEAAIYYREMTSPTKANRAESRPAL